MVKPTAIRTDGSARWRLRVVAAAAILLAALLAGIGWYQTRMTAPAAKTPAATPAVAIAPAKAPPKRARNTIKPAWSELTPQQQQALEPLASQWDDLGPVRKKKWLAISAKFSKMSAAEQQRVHQRMTEWLKLTPQQQVTARDSYSRAKKLEPQQKSARWEQYQKLPEKQKEELASTKTRKRIAALPSAQGNGRTVAPIKSTPKPVLELALTPQPGSYLTPQLAPETPVPAPKVVVPDPAPASEPEPPMELIQPPPLDPTQF